MSAARYIQYGLAGTLLQSIASDSPRFQAKGAIVNLGQPASLTLFL